MVVSDYKPAATVCFSRGEADSDLGHNDIMVYAPVPQAIMAVFQDS